MTASAPTDEPTGAPRVRLPLPLVAVGTLALLWLLASLSFPFGWDQGILAWIGDALKHGQAPYRDAWDMKGPFAYVVFATAETLFGQTLWAIRALDAILVTLAAVALARVIGRLAPPRVGWWAAPLFLLWYASGSYWQTAQPDGWVAMMMIGVAFAVVGRPGPLGALPLLAAGFLVGLCALVKPPYAAFGLVPLVYVALAERSSVPRLAGVAALLGAGAAMPVLLTAAWFLHHGAFNDLIDVYLRYPAQVYSRVATPALGARLRGVVEYVTEGRVAVLALPAALLGALVTWRRQRAAAAALLCWGVLALAIVMAQNRFFLYHWLVVMPPVALLAALGFGAALAPDESRADAPVRVFARIVLALTILHAAAHPLVDVARWAGHLAGRTDRTAWLEGFGDIPARDTEAADYLRAHTLPTDRVLVFGWNTSIVYMSGRENASRFGFSMPLFLGEGTEVRRRYRAEFLDAMQATPPTYIVVAPQSTLLLGKPYQLADFPEFAELVARHYAEERRFGELTLYRRVPPAAGS